MKRIFCLIMSVMLCTAFVACSNETTPKDTTTSGTSQSCCSTTLDTQGSQTTSDKPDVPTPAVSENDNVSEKVGDHVTVVYNPAYCKVGTAAEQGIGSKQNVTLTIEMKDGFIFDGWTEGNLVANGKEPASTEKTYSFTASEDVTVYANYSVTLNYHANGGTSKTGETYTQKYSVAWYKCPSTLPEQGYFTREGYTLSEYNTKPDGTGYAVSLGSRMFMDDKPVVDLYCIWEKQSPVTDFEFEVTNGKAAVTKYKGTDETVVIPDTYEGNPVTKIKSNAFVDSTLKKVILSKNVVTVENNAFALCDLESIVIFDSLMQISDKSFDSGAIKSLRVNAVLDLYSSWMQGQTTLKLDRLVYATGKGIKKVVIYGGSGALHGLDCSQIDDAFNNEYCVINVGSNANASAAFYFDWFEDCVTKDDVVLWVPEAGSYMLGSTRFSDRLWGVNAGHYDSFRYVDVSKYSGVFDTYSSFAQQHSSAQQSYEKCGLNYSKYGDLLTRDTYTNSSHNYNLFNQNPKDYTYMASKIESISEKGTRLYFTFASMDEDGTVGGKTPIKEAADDMAKYLSQITSAFPQLTVISEYENCLVPHDAMYNSEWHLLWEGAVIRSGKLAADIKTQLAKEGK